MPPSLSIERYQYRKTGTAENDRMLMVVNVLPDKINLGYEQFLFGIVRSVNHVAVTNLQQVREQLKNTQGDYVTLGFAPLDSQVTFSRKALIESAPLIAERYGIKPVVEPVSVTPISTPAPTPAPAAATH